MILKLTKLVAFLIPFLFLFLLLWQKDFQFEEDLGRHIKLGEIMINCHCVPTTNLFSYTFPSFAWFTNSWLSAVSFYTIFIHAGENGLLYSKLVLIIISFSLLYVYAWKNYSKFWSFVLSIPLLCIFYFRFGLRPEVFSFLLMSLFLILIEKYRKTNQIKYLWSLIPLEILWINFHIYFIFGIMIYSSLLLEKLFKKGLNKTLLSIFLLLSVSTFINPLTYQLVFLPFTIFHNYGGNVLENHSIFNYFYLFGYNFNLLNTWSFIVLECISGILILSYVGMITKWKNLSLYYICISLVGIVLGISMIRFLPLVSFLAFFPLVTNFSQIEQSLSHNWVDITFLGKGIFIILCCALMFLFVNLTVQNQLFGLSFEKTYQGEVSFIQDNHILGPMFNDFNDGAYMTFTLYPEQKVFIDSRAEAYPANFVQTYSNLLSKPEIFNILDKKYQFNYIVFENVPGATSLFIKYLLVKNDWIPVYVNHQGSIIFLRSNSKNASLIKRYGIKEKINVSG